jgi:Protein of unknown function (DUF2281)
LTLLYFVCQRKVKAFILRLSKSKLDFLYKSLKPSRKNMQSIVNLEDNILVNLRQLPPEKQQEVLDFTEFLRQKTVSVSSAHKPTLREIATMPLSERHKILASSIAATAQDFLTDPELTEFATLDEDWELDRV